jgi:hypothetical protein
MNWKITRPDADIGFRAGEPFAMVVPQRRGELERFRPARAPLSAMPDQEGYRTWYASRAAFLVDKELARDTAGMPEWQKDYMIGTAPGDGERFAEHQRRLRLQEFVDVPEYQHPGEVVQASVPRCGRPSGAVAEPPA